MGRIEVQQPDAISRMGEKIYERLTRTSAHFRMLSLDRQGEICVNLAKQYLEDPNTVFVDIHA